MEENTEENSLHLRLSAQSICRYHVLDITDRQTVGEHTYGAAQILRYLVEGKSSEYKLKALEAVLDHDVPEVIMGDSPHTTKLRYENLTDELVKVEQEIVTEFNLSQAESLAMEIDCKCADMLEMAWYGLRLVLKGVLVGHAVIENVENWLDGLRTKPEKALAMMKVIKAISESEDGKYES